MKKDRQQEQKEQGNRTRRRQIGVIITLAGVLVVLVAVCILTVISAARRGAGEENSEDAGSTLRIISEDKTAVSSATTEDVADSAGKILADMTLDDERSVLKTYAEENFGDDQYYVILNFDDYELLALANRLYQGEIGSSDVTFYAVTQDGSVQRAGNVQTDGSTTLVETNGDEVVSYISHSEQKLTTYVLDAQTRFLDQTSQVSGEDASAEHERMITQGGLHIIDFGNLAYSEIYRNLVTELQNEHGRCEVSSYNTSRGVTGRAGDTSNTGSGNEDNNAAVGSSKAGSGAALSRTSDADTANGFCYQGLCWVNLSDLNGDNVPELLVAYSEDAQGSNMTAGSASGNNASQNNTSSIQADRIRYTTEIYGIDNGGLVQIWSGSSGVTSSSDNSSNSTSNVSTNDNTGSSDKEDPAVYTAALGQSRDGTLSYLQYNGDGCIIITVDTSDNAAEDDRYLHSAAGWEESFSYISKDLFNYYDNSRGSSDRTAFAQTAADLQDGLYSLGLSYEEIRLPEVGQEEETDSSSTEDLPAQEADNIAAEEANISAAEKNLRNILRQRSGLQVLACYYADYDGDGNSEAFAMMGEPGSSKSGSSNAESSEGDPELGTSLTGNGDASSTAATSGAGPSYSPLQAQFWFVSYNGSVCTAVNSDTTYWGEGHAAAPHILDFGSCKYITLSDYGGGSGAMTRIYGVQAGNWQLVDEPYGMWINQANPGTRDFEITGDAFDATRDVSNNITTGHTYKLYYFYYDSAAASSGDSPSSSSGAGIAGNAGGSSAGSGSSSAGTERKDTFSAFREYGAVEISGDTFLQYDGADKVLSDIQTEHPAATVDSILYRSNNLLHVNYSVHSADDAKIDYYTKTLNIHGNSVTCAGNEEQGTYQTALFPAIAVYPY